MKIFSRERILNYNFLKYDDSNQNLLNEINYLNQYFGYQNTNIQEIIENLTIYKYRKNVSLALKSLNNLCIKIKVSNMENKAKEIEKLSEELSEIKNFFETRQIINEIKRLDKNFFGEKFLEKNYLDILLIL